MTKTRRKKKKVLVGWTYRGWEKDFQKGNMTFLIPQIWNRRNINLGMNRLAVKVRITIERIR